MYSRAARGCTFKFKAYLQLLQVHTLVYDLSDHDVRPFARYIMSAPLQKRITQVCFFRQAAWMVVMRARMTQIQENIRESRSFRVGEV